MSANTAIPFVPLCFVAPIAQVTSPAPALTVLRESRKAIPRGRCRQILVVGVAIQVEIEVCLPVRIGTFVLKFGVRPLQTSTTQAVKTTRITGLLKSTPPSAPVTFSETSLLSDS